MKKHFMMWWPAYLLIVLLIVIVLVTQMNMKNVPKVKLQQPVNPGGLGGGAGNIQATSINGTAGAFSWAPADYGGDLNSIAYKGQQSVTVSPQTMYVAAPDSTGGANTVFGIGNFADATSNPDESL